MQLSDGMHGQDCTEESQDSRRRRLSVASRLRIVATLALAALVVGLVGAYGALGTSDTAYGSGALAGEAGGDYNSAFGHEALYGNTTGSFNTATGYEALWWTSTGGSNTVDGAYALFWNTTGHENAALGRDTLYANTTGSFNTAVGRLAGHGDGSHPNTTGSYDTFLGYQAAPGTDNEISNATAVGANAVVSQSDSLVLGASGVNVGINNSAPASRLQVGAPSTSWGDYLQPPLVNSTDKTPPAGQCNSSTFRGRLVLQFNGKKTMLWACTGGGVWKTLAAK